MNITLARIDDRLIHGQVTTVWSKVANAQRIIICNDDVLTMRFAGPASPGRASGHEGQCR
jgi:mannose/fructose/N-acetylgalactosamine-specific phosphotransferase system component IIB